MTTTKIAEWTRTDQGDDEAETLRLVKLDSGKMFVCNGLDGAEFPYLVQVTSGSEVGDDFLGLYDLDGEQVDVSGQSFECVPLSEVPPEVVEQIETGWESGNSVVARVLAIGDRVEGGKTAEDHDVGTVLAIDGDAVTIAWSAGVRTTMTRAEALAIRKE